MKLVQTILLIWLCVEFRNTATKERGNKTAGSHCVPQVWNNITRRFDYSSHGIPCRHKGYVRKNTSDPKKIRLDEIKLDPPVEDNNVEDLGGTGILGSIQNLTYWAIKEEFIFDLAEQRLAQLRREVELLEDYIEDYQSSTGALIAGAQDELPTEKERGEFVAKSGIAAYRMTHRYVETLQKIKESEAETMVDKEFHDILWEHDKNTKPDEQYDRRSAGQIFPHWPNRIDLNLAKQSLIHIQEVHKFPFDELPEALAPESSYPPELNAFHCKEIGLYALHMEQFDSAVLWMEEAIQKVHSEEDDSESMSSLEVYMELVAQKHNDALTKTFDDNDPYQTDSIFTSYVTPFVFEHRETRLESEMNEIGISRHYNYNKINFDHLCAGYEFQTDREKARLKCWYDSSSHPYWTIGPLKKERLSWRPPLIKVYEFLGDGEIWDIQNLSSDHTSIGQSGVVGNFSQMEAAKARTSVNSWVAHGLLPKLEKKVEFLSGLEVSGLDASEELQVVEYVYGRLYLPHPDSLTTAMVQEGVPDSEETTALAKTGDRVMTVLFYLNDVEDGGATVFTYAGIAAQPEKGSAIMWENLYRNGTERDDTWHGACPVLYGHKIVANKWIRYNDQFQRFKCSLNQFV